MTTTSVSADVTDNLQNAIVTALNNLNTTLTKSVTDQDSMKTSQSTLATQLTTVNAKLDTTNEKLQAIADSSPGGGGLAIRKIYHLNGGTHNHSDLGIVNPDKLYCPDEDYSLYNYGNYFYLNYNPRSTVNTSYGEYSEHTTVIEFY